MSGSLVPRSYPQGGKGLVYIEHFLGLVSEFCGANQIYAMWFTCDNHVTLCNSPLLLHVRAVDALSCQNDASSCQSHMLRPACRKKRLRVGSRDETR